jgi:peptidoglycan/xylan/chitin deacetylase (PgdA/CDA1 family)
MPSTSHVLLALGLAGPLGACTLISNEGDDAVRPMRSVPVALSFDDTVDDQSVAAAMLSARGMRGTFYVNSTRFDDPDLGFMTVEQVAALAADGHEIGGHTLSHPRLAELDLGTARAEICDDRNALLAQGFAATSFAYPFGSSNAAVELIARECGYVSARTVGGLRDGDSCTLCPTAETRPPRNALDIRTQRSIHDDITLERLQAYVTEAEVGESGWLPLVFHHVCDGCNPNSIPPAMFGAFLDWLDERGTPVVTVSEAIAPAL